MLATVAFMLWAGPLAADPPPEALDPAGRPEGQIFNQPARYYIWHDSEGWRIRAASVKTNAFAGTVTVRGGRIERWHGVGLDANKGKAADQFRVSGDRTRLEFQFTVGKKSDGFDLKVSGDRPVLTFDLRVNGAAAKPKALFLGKAKAHPAAHPFALATPASAK